MSGGTDKGAALAAPTPAPESQERSILTSSLSSDGTKQNIERSNGETPATCCPCVPNNVPKNGNIRPPQNQSVLGSTDGPEALAPCSEAIRERVIEVGAAKRREIIECGLTTFDEDLCFPLITKGRGILFHDGLRTEARAQASPSRREVGDDAYVERLAEKETPASPETNTIAAAEQKERHELANLIKTRLLNVHPDDQDLELEDEDWTRICAALTEGQTDAG